MREKISRHVHSLCIGAAERAVQRQRQRASKIGRDAVATDAFHDRLRDAFATTGLDADRYVTILPPMSQTDFLQAVGQADIILDTPGWSGGNSTLDCLALDPAIVTLQGDFMRGRHTAAILQRIDAVETIASSVDD